MSVQQQQARDEDLFEFNNQLRHGIFEAYAGIINGMSPEKVNQYLLEPAPVRQILPLHRPSLLATLMMFPSL